MTIRSSSSTIALWAGCALIVASTVLWFVAPWVVLSAYEGKSIAILNKIIAGRATHPVDFYLELLKRPLRITVALGCSTGAVLLLAAVPGIADRFRKHANALAIIAFFASTVWFVIRIWTSVGLPHYTDESYNIVVGWMIHDGRTLYENVFSNHGPFGLALMHAVYALTESKDVAPYRIAQWLLVGLTGVVLALSPIWKNLASRLVAASVFLLLYASLFPLWRGHLLLYQASAGMLTLAALSLLFLPLMLGIRVPRWAARLGGAAWALIGFCAYSYGPSMLLLVLATGLIVAARDDIETGMAATVKDAAAGALVAVAVLAIWVLIFASMAGYFIYHFYVNQFIFVHYNVFSIFRAVTRLPELFASRFGWAIGAVVIFLLSIAAMVAHTVRDGWSVKRRFLFAAGLCLLLIAFIYLNPRGDEGQKDATLLTLGLGGLAIVIGRAGIPGTGSVVINALSILALSSAVLLLGWFHLVSPGYIALSERQILTRQEYVQNIKLIRELVPAGHVIYSPQAPEWYLETERAPASGAISYFPWQAEYNESPRFGRRIDPCNELPRTKPAVVIAGRDTAPRYHLLLRDYAPCLYDIFRSNYLRVANTPILVSKTLDRKGLAILAARGYRLEPVDP